MANTHTQTNSYGSEKKTSYYRQQTRHGHEHMNARNSCMGTFAHFVETFHRKTRARFETCYRVMVFVSCLSRNSTNEIESASTDIVQMYFPKCCASEIGGSTTSSTGDHSKSKLRNAPSKPFGTDQSYIAMVLATHTTQVSKSLIVVSLATPTQTSL